MSWRAAGSLLVLRKQIDTLAPRRSKASDGTVGDLRHRASKSDHNPNIAGVVTAMDITHDPRNGVDAGKIARAIADSRDRRIKYLISNGEICSSVVSPWQWRKYTGKNPHSKHFHLSVHGDYDNTASWKFDGVTIAPDENAPSIVARLTLRRGDQGDTVKVLQRLLTTIIVDGDFGRQTEAAVKAFQKRRKLVADGIVGQYTWAALEGK